MKKLFVVLLASLFAAGCPPDPEKKKAVFKERLEAAHQQCAKNVIEECTLLQAVCSVHYLVDECLALPVLETVIVSFMLANFEVLRASTLLVSTFMGGVFVLLMPLALLTAEGTGLEYTKTLPMNVNRIITSKTLIATLTYVPVPLVLLSMAFLKPLTSPLILLIPFFVILTVASASIFEIQLFLNYVTSGKIAAILHDLKKLVVGVATLILPLAVYAIVYIVSLSHIFAVSVMAVASASELSLAVHLLKHNNK